MTEVTQQQQLGAWNYQRQCLAPLSTHSTLSDAQGVYFSSILARFCTKSLPSRAHGQARDSNRNRNRMKA